jgi:phytoene dehydrogenase-like protein
MKKAVVIGAGFAGLSAACFLAAGGIWGKGLIKWI